MGFVGWLCVVFGVVGVVGVGVGGGYVWCVVGVVVWCFVGYLVGWFVWLVLGFWFVVVDCVVVGWLGVV